MADSAAPGDAPGMEHGQGAYAGGTYYEVEGEGPAVVLAGGGPGVGHAHYHPWFSRLAARHRIVYFDYLGTGRSARGACSIEAYAEQVEALREHLGLDALSLIGISFGGMPALAYALANPDRVTRLVLSNAQVGAATWQEGNIDAVNAALRAHFPERWRALLGLRERGVRSLDPAYQDLLAEVVHRLEWADAADHPRLRHDQHDGMDLAGSRSPRSVTA